MAIELNEDILHEAGIGSFFRPSQLEPLGISYRRLRQLERDEAVERIGWGLYRLADAEPTEHFSIALVCAQVPNAIVCLLSALQVHEIGTQLPRHVWIAIPHKAKPPRRLMWGFVSSASAARPGPMASWKRNSKEFRLALRHRPAP